jgi:hypothetical protein
VTDPPPFPSMGEDRPLTPHEAESIVEDRIERFGLGALPRVRVTAQGDGTWQVRWDHLAQAVAPMSRDAWQMWLEENVGSLDAGDLETTES